LGRLECCAEVLKEKRVDLGFDHFEKMRTRLKGQLKQITRKYSRDLKLASRVM
jgi:hypothetical protein